MTKSSRSVEITSERSNRVNVAMRLIERLTTGSTIDLKCSPTFSVKGTYPVGLTRLSVIAMKYDKNKPEAKLGTEAMVNSELLMILSVRLPDLYPRNTPSGIETTMENVMV